MYMMRIYACVLVTALIGASSASFLDYFRPSNWNGLKVTWGTNPISYFNTMPRTVLQAQRDGFFRISDCNTNSTYRGARYIKDGDTSLVLLYDVSGYIAGIQTVVPHNQPYDYPRRGLTPPFVEHEDGFYLTAYFVPPETICSSGRTSRQFSSEGTGSVLLIQNGPNPETQYMTIPIEEGGLTGTRWVQGQCFYTMGRHYWYDLSEDMNCDDFFPVFLMYNDGKLNGFGWAMGADLPSPRLEHPTTRSYGFFFKEIPQCLYNRGRFSTLHIYLTDRPVLNLC